MFARRRIVALLTAACLGMVALPGAAFALGGGWLPEPTKWVDEPSDLPITLEDGDVLHIKDVDYWAKGFTADTSGGSPEFKTISPISISEGATATIIVEGDVLLTGASALDDFFGKPRGAAPAIEVPETSTLVIYGAHDEELAETDGEPIDSLTLIGGAPAEGKDGGPSKGTAYDAGSDPVVFHVTSGGGGDGGGGGAAAIGGRGGDGGRGGAGTLGSMKDDWTPCTEWTAVWQDGDLEMIDGPGNVETNGRWGSDGEAGKPGEACGSVYLLGRLKLNASTASQNAIGGDGGASDGGGNDKDFEWMYKTWERYGGPGGGGGGGGGLAAPAIGSGGAGGSGGGGGATGSSDEKYKVFDSDRVQDCAGGSGGGGGWPNGGGGAGGGMSGYLGFYYYSDSSYGAAGGASSIAVGADGGRGYATLDGRIQNAVSGQGGAGATGIDGDMGQGGESILGRQTELGQNVKWGGKGGNGGAPTEAASWSAVQNGKRTLVLSTAGKYTFSQSDALGYSFGSGGGKGADKRVANTPYAVYDMADLDMDLAWPDGSDLVYTGSAHKPKVMFNGEASYSEGSDRDGACSPGAIAQNFTFSNVQGPQYGENIHAPQGTVSFTSDDVVPYEDLLAAASDPNRDRPVLAGSLASTFPIGKAAFTSVPIASDVPIDEARVAEPVELSLDGYEFKDGSGELSELWLDAAGTVGAPTVAWSVVEGAGTFSSDSGLATTFTPSTAGKVVVKAALSGMNDFEDYEATIILDNVAKGIATASVKFDNDAPSYGDEVSFTVSGVGELAKVTVEGAATLKSFDPATNKGILTCTDSGDAVVTVSRPEGQNWNAVSEDFDLAVKPRAIAATWAGTDDRTYDGSASSVTASFDDAVFRADLAAGEVRSVVNGGDAVLAGKNEACVELEGKHADDFEVTNPTATYLITIAEGSALGVRVLDAGANEEITGVVYGERIVIEAVVSPVAGDHKPLVRALSRASAPDASYFSFKRDGVELKGVPSAVTQGSDGSFSLRLTLDTASQQLALGENVIDVVFAGDANLPAAQTSASIVVEPREVTAAFVGDCTRPYDGTTALPAVGEDNTLAFELSDAVEGDDLRVDAAVEFESAAAGTKRVVAEGMKLAGGDAGWYTLTNDTAECEVAGITRAPLTISVGNVTIAHGDPLPEPEILIEGWVSDAERDALEQALRDMLTCVSSYKAGSDAGAYALDASLLEGELPAGFANYKFAYKAGVLTVEAPQVESRPGSGSESNSGKEGLAATGDPSTASMLAAATFGLAAIAMGIAAARRRHA